MLRLSYEEKKKQIKLITTNTLVGPYHTRSNHFVSFHFAPRNPGTFQQFADPRCIKLVARVQKHASLPLCKNDREDVVGLLLYIRGKSFWRHPRLNLDRPFVRLDLASLCWQGLLFACFVFVKCDIVCCLVLCFVSVCFVLALEVCMLCA